jgi:hypothetical protein
MMFARVETMLERADAGCQLFANEIGQTQSLIVNTLYFLELEPGQRDLAELARQSIVAYAYSRCVNQLHTLMPRDEQLRSEAYAALDALRTVAQPAALNGRANYLNMMAA